MTFSPQPEASGYFIAPRLQFSGLLDEMIYYHLLNRANYRDSDKCKRGQAIVSQTKIAEELGLSRYTIQRAFERLKGQGFISWKRLPQGQGILVTIADYDRYQNLDFAHHMHISRTSHAHHDAHHGAHHDVPEIADVALDSGYGKDDFAHHDAHHDEHLSHISRTSNAHTRTKELKTKENAAAVYKHALTVEDPQEQHQQQEANIFTTFERAYGRIPTPFQVEVFSSFIEDGLPEALVCRAIEKAAMDNKGPRYAEAICRDWLAKGIRTVEQAEREEREWRERQQKVVPMRRTSPEQPTQRQTLPKLTPEEIERIVAEDRRRLEEMWKNTKIAHWILEREKRRAMNQNAGAAAQ